MVGSIKLLKMHAVSGHVNDFNHRLCAFKNRKIMRYSHVQTLKNNTKIQINRNKY